MAEAHSAVAFQFAVTDEGVVLHFDKAAIQSAASAVLHILHNRYSRVKTAFLKGIFPATPLSLLVLTSGVLTFYAVGVDPTFGVLSLFSPIPRYLNLPLPVWNTGCLLAESVLLWTVLFYAQRYTLRLLLLYKGWMFDDRGKQSATTKIWAGLVRLVGGTNHPLLGSYQQSLPHLPLPGLSDTCSRYLRSVRPLLSDEEFKEKEKAVEEFKRGPGPKLQWYLRLKYWTSSNYVTDWWEKYVYHGWRGSVMINSNYYATDQIGDLLTNRPAARAGIYCHVAMKMKSEIENETLQPLIIRNLIPLCSHQYKRLFGTCRIPGKEQDHLVRASPTESRHIVVHRNGRWYRVPLYHKNRLLSPAEIEMMIEVILEDESDVNPMDQFLSSLTTAERPFWAEVRETYFSKGINRKNMEMIEKAAFILTMDDSPRTVFDPVDSSELLSKYCAELLHGEGYKFWFDKSFSVIIYKNGVIGTNAEHSWADAPIIGHLLEYCSTIEHTIGLRPDKHNHGYGELDKKLPRPQKMNWDLPEEVYAKVQVALSKAQEAISNIDLFVLEHKDFGKGLMKKCKISPDAFIQMALQLAHYRDVDEFSLTYEASMTRLYLEGRTETVRSLTVEAVEFAHAMCNPQSNNEERKRLLVKACDNHVTAYKDAMIGRGIDRHLFCLYVVSRGKNIPSEFLQNVISEKWRLSTSQTPTQQTGRIDFDNNPSRICPGGGFGPVAEDGYGVSYIIPGDKVLYFHISSFKDSPRTNSRRFAKNIKQSLRDMIDLFDIQQ